MQLKVSIKALILVVATSGITNAYTIRIYNNCGYTIWPAISQHNSGHVPNFATIDPQYTGARLAPGAVFTVQAPDNWVGGRIWGRTGCNADASSCTVGTCAGALHCTDYSWNDQLTVAEFDYGNRFGYGNNRRFYDLSVVHGFNVPMQIYPASATSGCLIKTVYSRNPPVGQAWLSRESINSPAVADCDPNADFGITFCPILRRGDQLFVPDDVEQ